MAWGLFKHRDNFTFYLYNTSVPLKSAEFFDYQLLKKGYILHGLVYVYKHVTSRVLG